MECIIKYISSLLHIRHNILNMLYHIFLISILVLHIHATSNSHIYSNIQPSFQDHNSIISFFNIIDSTFIASHIHIPFIQTNNVYNIPEFSETVSHTDHTPSGTTTDNLSIYSESPIYFISNDFKEIHAAQLNTLPNDSVNNSPPVAAQQPAPIQPLIESKPPLAVNPIPNVKPVPIVSPPPVNTPPIVQPVANKLPIVLPPAFQPPQPGQAPAATQLPPVVQAPAATQLPAANQPPPAAQPSPDNKPPIANQPPVPSKPTNANQPPVANTPPIVNQPPVANTSPANTPPVVNSPPVANTPSIPNNPPVDHKHQAHHPPNKPPAQHKPPTAPHTIHPINIGVPKTGVTNGMLPSIKELPNEETHLRSCYRGNRKVPFSQYWIPKENEWDETNSGKRVYLGSNIKRKIFDKNHVELGLVPIDMYEKCQMEGTCLLENGDLINIDNSTRSFVKVGTRGREHNVFGLGSGSQNLVPFVSVAANDLPYGQTLYISELDGLDLGGNQKHNGCVRVDDDSWSFDSCQIDFFVLSYVDYLWLDLDDEVNVKLKNCEIKNYITKQHLSIVKATTNEAIIPSLLYAKYVSQ